MEALTLLVQQMIDELGVFPDDPDDTLFLTITTRELMLFVNSMQIAEAMVIYTAPENALDFHDFILSLLAKIDGALGAQKNV